MSFKKLNVKVVNSGGIIIQIYPKKLCLYCAFKSLKNRAIASCLADSISSRDRTTKIVGLAKTLSEVKNWTFSSGASN